MSNWRSKEVGQTIVKFDAKKDSQILAMKFLDDGKDVEFEQKEFNEKTGTWKMVIRQATEFQVEFNNEVCKFSTGSARLLKALSLLADDLTGKRIQMTKRGLGMDTLYEAKLIK